jgi:hypothetical protein
VEPSLPCLPRCWPCPPVFWRSRSVTPPAAIHPYRFLPYTRLGAMPVTPPSVEAPGWVAELCTRSTQSRYGRPGPASAVARSGSCRQRSGRSPRPPRPGRRTARRVGPARAKHVVGLAPAAVRGAALGVGPRRQSRGIADHHARPVYREVVGLGIPSGTRQALAGENPHRPAPRRGCAVQALPALAAGLGSRARHGAPGPRTGANGGPASTHPAPDRGVASNLSLDAMLPSRWTACSCRCDVEDR